MEYRENGTRYKDYCEWEAHKQSPYNYERNGLLRHILSRPIVTSQNQILQYILTYYEKTLVFLMKYVDRLKHFKNYHWKNR